MEWRQENGDCLGDWNCNGTTECDDAGVIDCYTKCFEIWKIKEHSNEFGWTLENFQSSRSSLKYIKQAYYRCTDKSVIDRAVPCNFTKLGEYCDQGGLWDCYPARKEASYCDSWIRA